MHWGLNKDKRRRQAIGLVLSTSYSPQGTKGPQGVQSWQCPRAAHRMKENEKAREAGTWRKREVRYGSS